MLCLVSCPTTNSPVDRAHNCALLADFTIFSLQTDLTPQVNETRIHILPPGKKWLTLPKVHNMAYFGALSTGL